MAAPKKTDKSYKKSRAYKHARPVHRVSKARLAIAAGVIAGLCVLAFFAFFYSPTHAGPKPRKKGNLSLSYVKEKPEIVERNSSGDQVYTSRSRAVTVSAEGNLYCTPENSDVVTARQLNTGELKSLRTKVKATKADQQADDVDTTNDAHVNNYTGLSIKNDDGTRKRTFVYKPQLESSQFKSAVSIMESLCAGTTQPVPDSEVPDWNPVTFLQNKNLAQRVASAMMPRAQAASIAIDTNAENIQKTDLDAFRAARGLTKLYRSPCLDNAARGWAQYMATSGILAHSDIRAVGSYYCGSLYDALGENVGYGGNSQQIFDAFVASQGHYNNLIGGIDPAGKPIGYNLVGLGAYYNATTSRLWVDQFFAKCVSTECTSNTSYLKKSY